MCLISGLVKDVSNTKILVAPLVDEDASNSNNNDNDNNNNKSTNGGVKRQLTVYCNKVSVQDKHAVMVLPFPEGKFEPFDLTNYATLFKDMNKACWGASRAMATNSAKKYLNDNYENKLEVFQNGSYATSVVPHLTDFSRLEDKVFEVEPELLEFMKQQYPTGYSFVVCKLEGSKEYHPFGYIHDTLPGGYMFIPTMHYHTHETIEINEHDSKGIEMFSSDLIIENLSPREEKKMFLDQPKSKVEMRSAPYEESTYNTDLKGQVTPNPYKPDQVIDDTDEPKERTKRPIIRANTGSIIKHEIKADWNHEIYCWNCPLAFVPNGFQFKQVKFRPHFLEMVHLPEDIQPVNTMFAYKVHNYAENHDLLCAVN